VPDGPVKSSANPSSVRQDTGEPPLVQQLAVARVVRHELAYMGLSLFGEDHIEERDPRALDACHATDRISHLRFGEDVADRGLRELEAARQDSSRGARSEADDPPAEKVSAAGRKPSCPPRRSPSSHARSSMTFAIVNIAGSNPSLAPGSTCLTNASTTHFSSNPSSRKRCTRLHSGPRGGAVLTSLANSIQAALPVEAAEPPTISPNARMPRARRAR
jgi:hypothetical protein